MLKQPWTILLDALLESVVHHVQFRKARVEKRLCPQVLVKE